MPTRSLGPELSELVGAIAIYAPLTQHRVISLVRYGPVENMTRILAVMEILVLTTAITLYFRSDRLH